MPVRFVDRKGVTLSVNPAHVLYAKPVDGKMECMLYAVTAPMLAFAVVKGSLLEVEAALWGEQSSSEPVLQGRLTHAPNCTCHTQPTHVR